MTIVEQVASDLEYQGLEVTVNIWRGGEQTTVHLVWNGHEYVTA